MIVRTEKTQAPVYLDTDLIKTVIAHYLKYASEQHRNYKTISGCVHLQEELDAAQQAEEEKERSEL